MTDKYPLNENLSDADAPAYFAQTCFHSLTMPQMKWDEMKELSTIQMEVPLTHLPGTQDRNPAYPSFKPHAFVLGSLSEIHPMSADTDHQIRSGSRKVISPRTVGVSTVFGTTGR